MRPTAFAIPILLVTASIVGAQQIDLGSGPAHPSSSIMRPTDRVWFDEPGDGAIWVRGSDYKASFSEHGATFVPFLGSDAPRNFPVSFILEEARAGSTTLPLTVARPRRDRQSVVFDRGSFREVYRAKPLGIEQIFEWDRPVAGDLVLVIRAESELAAHAGEEGMSFSNALGGVRYGRATAIDSDGATLEVGREVRDGRIVLTVPAAFVEHARFPLTIDPIISSFSASQGSGLPNLNSDVAYDWSWDMYMVVFEEAYSATDHDVGAVTLDLNGAQLGFDYVDYTGAFWSAPRIANNDTSSSFLIVAERHVGATSEIWARASYAENPFPMEIQFLVSSLAGSSSTHPCVGGSPSAKSEFPFFVCWQRTATSGNKSIWGTFLGTNIAFSPVYAIASGVGESNPSISRTGFLSDTLGVPTIIWSLVFQRTYSSSDEDICRSSVRFLDDGTASVDGTYVIDFSSASDTNPCISSAALNGQELVAYERNGAGGTRSIRGGILNGLFAIGPLDLSALVGASGSYSQFGPCADSDGVRFVLGYSQESGLSSNAYISTLHVAGASLGVSEPPVLLPGGSGPDERMQVTSTRSGAEGTLARYLLCFDSAPLFSSLSTIKCTLYDGRSNAAAGPADWFHYLTPGCGGLSLHTNGRPSLGEAISCSMTGVTGSPLIAISPVTPSWHTLCSGCTLILDLANVTIFPGSFVYATVPSDGAFVNVQIALQGADIGSAGGCAGSLSFRLTEGVIVTIL